MQRSFGAPPVTLFVFALFLFFIHVSVTLFCLSQISSLTKIVDRGQAQLSAPRVEPVATTSPEEAEENAQSLRRLSSNSGLLAGYKEVYRALLWIFLVTVPVLVGSIVWVRDPRSS